MSNSKTSPGGARGVVAKPSQDNKKDEFFALVKSCAQKSDDQKTLLLRSRKYNGRTALIILRHPLTLVVMYPDSQDRLPGYEQCLKDKQIITGDMYPKEGEPDVVLCAEAVAFVHQAPGEQTYVETPDIEVGHDGVETAWKFYLAWRNDLRFKLYKCPVTLALYAFAMLQGWSDSQTNGLKQKELAILYEKFGKNSHENLQVVMPDAYWVDPRGMVKKANSEQQSSLEVFFDNNLREAKERQWEGYVLDIANIPRALKCLRDIKKERFYFPHASDKRPRDRCSLKNKEPFQLTCAVQVKSQDGMPRDKGQKNFPLRALRNGEVEKVGYLKYPPKYLYSLTQGSWHAVEVPFTWGSRESAFLTGIKTPLEGAMVRSHITWSDIRAYAGDLDDALNAVPHFGAVTAQKQRLKAVVAFVEDLKTAPNTDSSFIQGLPLRTGQRDVPSVAAAPVKVYVCPIMGPNHFGATRAYVRNHGGELVNIQDPGLNLLCVSELVTKEKREELLQSCIDKTSVRVVTPGELPEAMRAGGCTVGEKRKAPC